MLTPPARGAAGRKLELSHADGRNAPVPSTLLTQFGAELIGD
jgi:hypothetical protein